MSTRHGERAVEISRVTRAGRTITYSLRVIQQPERARACGSGAKSSADRRPVDPPPVVELRVFEGEGTNGEDITFGYEANFFLYASLELARPMAHSRNHPSPSAQPVPVLTGMPVSGMAYLDRPTEAGYFIFPDLSVRHEGRYKLAFNLYEQTKKDQDLDVEPSPQSQQNAPNGPHTADSSFDFRMEIKSNTFHVWSAKKFPGLKESTVLSRTVAEQGCRVRIRRDVRMRRRGGEKGTEYDEAEEYNRSRAEEAERGSRSRSTSSVGSESPSRQTGQPYYQSQPGNNLAFMQGNTNSQFAGPPPPSQHYVQSQPAGSHQHIQQQPPPQRYQQPPLQQLYSQPAPPPAQPHNNYAHERQHPQSAYPANAPRDNFEPEHRRASVPYPSANSRDFQSLDPNLNRPPPQQQFAPRHYNAPAQAPVNIAPIKLNTPIEPKFSNPIPSQQIVPEYPNPPRDRTGSYHGYPAGPPEPARIGSKRGFDSVFKSFTQPLHNGMRPDALAEATPQDDDEDEDEYSFGILSTMEYKRADGNTRTRGVPDSVENGN